MQSHAGRKELITCLTGALAGYALPPRHAAPARIKDLVGAVACCARNNGEKVNAIWQDVTTLKATIRYDAVIMNPPFHTGKNEDVDLGRAFIAKAAQILKPGGRLFLVANCHLGYEVVVPGLTSLYESGGFKVLAKAMS